MDDRKSVAGANSNGTEKVQQASTVLDDVRERINKRTVENFLLIWLDSNIDENNGDHQSALTQIRQIVSIINTFTDVDQCVDFLTDIDCEKVIMLVSSTLCQQIVPLVHDILQLHTIFIFSADKTEYVACTNDSSKIKEVFADITPMCNKLKQLIQQYEHNAMPISYIATSDNNAIKNLDKLDCLFMYTLIFKEILLSIEFEQEQFEEFIHDCRERFAQNNSRLQQIKKFELEYHDRTPIWWYTYDCFLSPMVNLALRTMDAVLLVNVGFYIRDLHRQIKELYKYQFGGQHSADTFTFYRGQGLFKTDFDRMMNNKGGLMAFNSFLSTSKNRDVSFLFAESNLSDPNVVGILFVLTIDPSQSTTPFASITDISQFHGENEILFSMHSIFRIEDIQPINANNRLFQVDLTLTSDNDKDLRVLTESIREETRGFTEWDSLGEWLRKIGQFDRAEQVYHVLLSRTTDDEKKANIHNQMGQLKIHLGEYKEAIGLFEESLEINRKILPPYHLNSAGPYNNIGSAYYETGDYSKALNNYEKALEILHQSRPPDHPDLSVSYNNIGLVYQKMGDHPKALLWQEKALEIRHQSLPPNHPTLSASYNNIGMVYGQMNKDAEALLYFEKALEIQQQSLPPNHPDLSAAYQNIGSVYDGMCDYPKALFYYQKALKTKQQSFSSNHPDLASSYNNIGLAYYKMNEYAKALEYFEKTVEIRQKSLPPDHPDLSATYNNLGSVYGRMDEYEKALLYLEKVFDVKQQSLPSMHPSLGSAYYNIGLVYDKMGKYSKALFNYEKVLEALQSCSLNDPKLSVSYNNIGEVYRKMGDYPKALLYHKKALEVRQQALPLNHSTLSASYDDIGTVYGQMGEYGKGLLYFEKALEIKQQLFPPNHPSLGATYYCMGLMYDNMGDDSKACLFYERAKHNLEPLNRSKFE